MLNAHLLTEYARLLRVEKTKVVKVFVIIVGISALVSAVFGALIGRGETFLILCLVFAGTTLIMGLTTGLIARFFTSEKPLYTYLYPEIVADINFNESVTLSYEAYPLKKEFVKIGGLFPAYATKLVRYRLSFETTSQFPIEVYDAYLYTQSDKSTIVYLNGLYFVMDQRNSDLFQLRSSGAPHLKDFRFARLDTRGDLKEYAQDAGSVIEAKYYQLFDQVRTDFGASQVFVGGTGTALHVGVGLRLVRKVKVLNQEIYDQLRSSLLGLCSFAEGADQVLLSESNPSDAFPHFSG